jgi:peptidyl-tRNA hydrolase
VLGRPSMGEEDQIISAIDQAIAVIPLVLAGQINKAMTQLNRRPPAEKASTVE